MKTAPRVKNIVDRIVSFGGASDRAGDGGMTLTHSWTTDRRLQFQSSSYGTLLQAINLIKYHDVLLPRYSILFEKLLH